MMVDWPNWEILGDLMRANMVLILVMMTWVWLLAKRLKNAGVVDIAWAGGFTWLAGIDVLLGPGLALRQSALLATMASLASIRLAYHLFLRMRERYPVEDGRYHALREKWGGKADSGFLALFYGRGVLMILACLPFALGAMQPQPGWSAWHAVAVGLWMFGFWYEMTADRQLAAFKADPANAGKVCRTGLWKGSRHPNYFGEWLMWMAYAIYVQPVPGGWLAWISPILMLFSLTQVTGVRAMESHALKHLGDAYAEYQRSTSAFIPGLKPRTRSTLPS